MNSDIHNGMQEIQRLTVDIGTGCDTLFPEARIREAQRVWAKAYGREVSEQEAVEILAAVKRLARVLLERAKQS